MIESLNPSIILLQNVNFIGKESLMNKKNQKPKKIFVMLTLKESKPGYPLLLHDEPIIQNGKIIGRTTSGNYSFNYKKNLAFGYINYEISKDKIQIEVEKKYYEAKIENNSLHDPKNLLIKS